VNNISFASISYPKALEILRNGTHLSIMVKSNVLGFKEMLSGDAEPHGKVSCPKIMAVDAASTGHFFHRTMYQGEFATL